MDEKEIELTKEQEKEIEDFQEDLWKWSKEVGIMLNEKEISIFASGWKKGKERGRI